MTAAPSAPVPAARSNTRELDPHLPQTPSLSAAWRERQAGFTLATRARRRQRRVIVVGSGLAGAAAAATLSELGFQVSCLCIQDSPRRAHSVAAQGGINASKNYQNDGDSVQRLFLDTLRGGDYRSRELNVHRLAELSLGIIDQCVAQGVPFAREYGGQLENRSFGGALVSRTFYARGVTGQQLLLGAYQALLKEVDHGGVQLLPRREMLELIVEGGRARGVVARHLPSGTLEAHRADAVVLASGGYASVFHQSTNAQSSNATAVMRAYEQGAAFANPCFVQFHPTCLPPHAPEQGKLILMSEALRNDGRVWVPRTPGDRRAPESIPEAERDYYLERMYPRYGNLAPRDLASRAAKGRCDAGLGVGPDGRGVYLDLAEALARESAPRLVERYANLFELYQRATGSDPLRAPMIIYPAAHYSMGGLWVDYDLMSNLPGLFVIGEANFSDHGANRLGASALLQGLADGYFILPQTASSYLAGNAFEPLSESAASVRSALARAEQRTRRLLGIGGSQTAREFHTELGRLLWSGCGLSRNRNDLQRTAQAVAELRARFWRDLRVTAGAAELNQELERAGRVADYLLLGELMCLDALQREESAGCHFREEYQTAEGEALRRDGEFTHVAAWFYAGEVQPPRRTIEPLQFQHVTPAERSYR